MYQVQRIMLFRCLLIVLAFHITSGLVTGQDEFSRLLAPDTEFSPQFEESQTIDVDTNLMQIDAQTVELQVTVTPPSGFYIYSMTTPAGQKTRIVLEGTAGLTPVQPEFQADRPPKTEFNEIFEDNLEKYTSAVTWSQQLRATSPLNGTIQITGSIEGQICTISSEEGGVCIPLRPAPKFAAELTVDQSAASVNAKPGLPSAVAVMHDDADPQDSHMRHVIQLTPASAVPGEEVALTVRAELAPGWHTYSTTMSTEIVGGTPTQITLIDVTGLKSLDESFTPSALPSKKDVLGDILELHEKTVTWTRRFTVTDASATITGDIRSQACTEKTCEVPGKASFAIGLGGSTTIPAATFPVVSQSRDGSFEALPDLDVFEQDSADFGSAEEPQQQGMMAFLLLAAVSGFVALLTPCVFPMIPVTVAFFLKQGESGKGNTTLLAIVYCLGIIFSFTVIGVLVTIFFGPQQMTRIANNPWLNLVFAAAFVAFALMLMGVFEVRVPASVLNWTSKREGQGGLIGVLFMALTFTLVSFTCTTAFVATVLTLATQGSFLRPVLGMLTFSTVFAFPFFFLALFPGMLAKLPKSGGWMQKVKSTAGLIELAFVVKFLSVADIGFSPNGMPRFLDFTTAIVIWATLAFVTGLYLLGVFRFSEDSPSNGISPLGGLWGIGSLGLALLLCVGLFSPMQLDNWVWNRIVGFAPPQFEVAVANGVEPESDFVDQFAELGSAKYSLVHDGLAYSLQLKDAVQVAKEHNRPLFIDFTGTFCINCRDMEKSVLNRPEILDILATLPRAQLFLDSIPGDHDESDKARLLVENQELSDELAGGQIMPAYVILAPDGQTVMSKTHGLLSREAFRDFLEAGIQRFEESQPKADITTMQTSRVAH